MIIWTRWGIVAFLFAGLSVGLGFLVESIFAPGAPSGSKASVAFLGVGFVLGAAALWAFVRYAIPHLDKPQPQFVRHKLAQPLVDHNGAVVTHQTVPVVNQQTGEQVYSRPSSTLFFIPIRFWPYLMAAGGVLTIFASLNR